MLNALRNINNMEWMETHPVIFGRICIGICIGSFVTGAGIAAIISIIRYKRKKTKKN